MQALVIAKGRHINANAMKQVQNSLTFFTVILFIIDDNLAHFKALYTGK
jgi:N-dimethylarginine dimethylaminohydrolase